MEINLVLDEVTVIGYVNKALGDKGFELARPIRVKDEATGAWETKGSNYFKVWFDPRSVEGFQQARVTGRLKIFESTYEGKTRLELHLTATSVEEFVREPKPVTVSDAPF